MLLSRRGSSGPGLRRSVGVAICCLLAFAHGLQEGQSSVASKGSNKNSGQDPCACLQEQTSVKGYGNSCALWGLNPKPWCFVSQHCISAIPMNHNCVPGSPLCHQGVTKPKNPLFVKYCKATWYPPPPPRITTLTQLQQNPPNSSHRYDIKFGKIKNGFYHSGAATGADLDHNANAFLGDGDGDGIEDCYDLDGGQVSALS